jgi:hypothetical protein
MRTLHCQFPGCVAVLVVLTEASAYDIQLVPGWSPCVEVPVLGLLHPHSWWCWLLNKQQGIMR